MDPVAPKTRAFRNKHKAGKSSRMSGYVYLAILIFISAGLVGISAAFALPLTWAHLFTVVIALLYSNFIEYALHRWVLHKPLLRGPYRTHTAIHHRLFTDRDMEMEEEEDLLDIVTPFSSVLVIYLIAAWAAGLFGILTFPSLGWTFFGVCMLYYILFELTHLGSHAPNNHWCFRIPLLSRGMALHRDHHDPRIMRTVNFNIVAPIFDVIFRTLH